MSEDVDSEIRKAQIERLKEQGALVGLGSSGGYDAELYEKPSAYETHIEFCAEEAQEEQAGEGRRRLPTYTAPDTVYRDLDRSEEEEDVFRPYRRKTVAETEDEYHAQVRGEFSKASGRVVGARSYREVLEETLLEKEERELRVELARKEREQQSGGAREEGGARKRSRWDVASALSLEGGRAREEGGVEQPRQKKASRWDQTPADLASGGQGGSKKASRWDQTQVEPAQEGQATPRKRSRWDQTPVMVGSGMQGGLAPTPVVTSTSAMETPVVALGVGPAAHMMTPEVYQTIRRDAEIQKLNRPLSREELNQMLPGEAEGFAIVEPPASYLATKAQSRQAETPMTTPMFTISGVDTHGLGIVDANAFGVSIELGEGLPELRPEDRPFFEKLLDGKDASQLTPEQVKERRVLKLLLKVKNGMPLQRKQALRQLSDKAREFGPSVLFDKILPLLMSPTLMDQERHLLVKVIDRVLYKLEDLVRPYVREILAVIQPLLIDPDYYARIEGREVISNLAKAAGLYTMIKEMRPTIDSSTEFVRNTTARAFAVVAAALGPPQLLLFLRAVCQSKKSWQARHTGIKIVQQMAILLGCAILPYLGSLVDIIAHGLQDEHRSVKIMTALAIAALAEASAPYGIERFDAVLKPLFYGIRQTHGKVLAAFLKAIGYLVPLMDAEHANYYSKEVMTVLVREFMSPDDEMKKIVLKVIKQCVGTEGAEASYIRQEILPPFFVHFWVNRMALDTRNYREVVDTTVELANKVGAPDVVKKLVEGLKAESEPFRKMAAETIDKILTRQGAAELSDRLVYSLVDGLLYAFQIQTDDSAVVLSSFARVINQLGLRSKPYLLQIKGVIAHRLTNRIPQVRQLACDLIAKIASVMKLCNEEAMMGHLGVILFENLGEEYPDVLGSILGALKSIVNVIGMNKMTPPINDLLPRLTPILKNRKEKVQENCIDLVGRIADRGKDYVHPREWVRICFELLEMLKAHKKGIRRAAVATFGYIAAAVGPAEVLSTLLNNLRVQDRQNRVCTTVAIAIVAETCQPYTVLPALMNEYRVLELNVQNGVLKAMSFLFEYISEMGKDYIYAVTPLLEDALMDRDTVHRQTACSVVKHISLGVAGLGAEDALTHLLNYVWPNIFETSPHVINAVIEAIDGLRVALGAPILMQYLLQGLFHPARKVRQTYWKLYNNMYIGAVDSMVPSFPRLPDDERNYYSRPELDLFV
ncbi:LOW QUALITY PROTEIN: splicing factor 3B subunit 1-like [Schistocerca gregaria]|uniref:LOW QUALITY PROTEIN: splicing factor 3B subunit 1-like n=1 Tax=Schistocerca gregaria TaxID=7010 RepID=UPI00211E9513|nr:LOW QUALITY PROTEIN: splicing factor 3B subunit 1-like [Schistocerca gregaria]